jgi:hypothetical protein
LFRVDRCIDGRTAVTKLIPILSNFENAYIYIIFPLIKWLLDYRIPERNVKLSQQVLQ